MSGGSMDYAFRYIDDAADHVKDKEVRDLMKDLAKLMHDLEWWYSGDYGKADYEETLAEFKKKWFKGSRKDRLKAYIDESLAEVKKELYTLIGEDA